MHRIVVLALDGVIPFDLGIPFRIFGAAGDAEGKPVYSVRSCSTDGKPVRTEADFRVAVEHDATALAEADTVVIPPSHELTELCAQERLPEPVAEALSYLRSDTRKVAICTGAFVLAAAGFLDGRPVTTHWRETDRLQETFPKLDVNQDVLFIDDGDVLTSAGAAAGVDLCLHLVRRDRGSETANGAARLCVVPPWRLGGQAQYVKRPIPEPGASSTAETRAWALTRLADPIGLSDLAAHAGMTRRTFSRRFRDEVGVSAGQWLTNQRIEQARNLLETTDLPVDEVAARVGFGTADSLRRHLRDRIGVSPNTYRTTFRAAE